MLVKAAVSPGGDREGHSPAVPLSPLGFEKERVASQELPLPFPVLHLLSCPVLPFELTAHGLSFFAKFGASFYLVFFSVRADVNTLTHEKYVPHSFHILVGRVRKIIIITRNCTWVICIASWPQGTESAVHL